MDQAPISSPLPADAAPADHWRRSWWKRGEVAVIAGLGYPLLAALGATYRFKVDGLEHLRAAEALGPPIHAFWHGRILPGAIYFKRRGIVVITSENFDGEWIARIITRFGYGTARGSSSRGARTRESGATGCRVAGENHGTSPDSVSPRGDASLDAWQLGPHPDSQALCHRRAGLCAANTGAGDGGR
jgi:hypothetical protein